MRKPEKNPAHYLSAARNTTVNPYEGLTVAQMKAKYDKDIRKSGKSAAELRKVASQMQAALKRGSTKSKPKRTTKNTPKANTNNTAKGSNKNKKPANTTKKAQSTSDAMKRDYNKSRSKTIAEAMAKAAKGKKLTDAQRRKKLTDTEDYSTAKRFQTRYR